MARESDLARVGAHLRVLRENARRTQQEVADALGIHRMTIWRIEHGRFDLGLSQALALARFLGVDPGALLRGLSDEQLTGE